MKEIEIPEDYEARIEGSKVILELKGSEDERIRQAIESIIRVYGKTQGEWLAGYDMDTLVVHLRDAFAHLERQKENPQTADFIPADCASNAKCENEHNKPGDFVFELRQIISRHRYADLYGECVDDEEGMAREIMALCEQQKEQKPTQSKGESLVGNINEKSEYDKGYRAGIAYQLKQTEQYKIDSTFMGLIPCWVNAPSELQPSHKYHGRNAVIMHENNGGFRCCFIDDEKAATVHLSEDTYFIEGWRKKPTEWSEEDEKMLKNIILDLRELRNHETDEKLISDYKDEIHFLENRFKSLRPQPQRKDTYYDIIHNILDTLKDMDFMKIAPEHRVSLLNDIRVKCKNADECAAILDEPYWKPSEEQIFAIVEALKYIPNNKEEWIILENLMDDLKKLSL